MAALNGAVRDRTRRLVAAGLAVVGLGLLVGCAREDGPDQLTAPPPPAGFSRVVGTGFTIDMPAAWRQPALDAAAFDQTASALRQQNPQLARAVEEARTAARSGGGVFAIDPADGSTVNLIVTATDGRKLDAVVAQAAAELRQVGAESLRQETVALAGHPAARLRFTLPVRGESGTVAVPEVQYYVVRAGRLYILTLFGTSPSLPVIADSLRFT